MVVSSLEISESNRLTIISYDNSGEIKFDVDIEMEQGYWNTSGSRLWTKIRDYMHDELVATYKDMRANGVTYENIMSYMYDEQIAKIPQRYYNMDFDIKYAPYADTYLGKAHGDGLQHMKRWLKKRFIFCDTLFDYAPSYENDVLTIRANTLDQMNLTIETYTPLYQHVSFYNGNMEKIKVKPGEPITFSGYAQTATDQEVLIYGGSNIKKITGISSCNPNSMLIGDAPRLTELDISNCPILTIVNSNKANFSPHTYLNKLNMSNCPQLGGNLNVSNSPLLQEIDARGSAITGLLMPPSLRNLTTLKLPNTLSSLTLNDVNLLHTLELDEGSNLQSISLTNCNNLTNTVNFDITNASTVKLDNSYHTEELYMSEVTDLTLKNMHSLQKVIFTPNSEYSEFDINNVINGANYKITTFNNPMMTDFITTAPHRLSYKNGDVVIEYYDKISLIDGCNQLDSVIFNTTQYIDTGFTPTTNTTIEFDAKMEYTKMYAHWVGCEGEKKIQWAYDSSLQVSLWSMTPTTNLSIRQTYTISCTSSSTYNLLLFSGYNLGKIETDYCGKGTLYSCKIYDNGELVRNYIPFEKDGVACLYEEVSKEFIYPVTGTLTGGQEVNFDNSIDMNDKFVTITQLTLKNYGDITPNTVFTANTLDLSDTQFQNVKFLCTTDIYNLKVPTTMKNFYCDSAFDIDTDVIEDASYEVIHNELIEPYTTNYESEVLLNEAVPNIIPSSANGSLIFNMYSNNTTAPTSTSPYMWDLTGLKLEDFYTYGMNNWVKQDESGNITMPQRLPGYSVRLVNADITPDEYPTMLYPKLIDITLPITGKLDYTKYNGTSLAWAYAYTTGDVSINPLDSQSMAKQITNDYNKLYGTDYVDNEDVWVYKDTDINKFSSNDKITKAYIELTQDNYKTRIDEVLQWYPNCTDLYLFEDGSVTSLEQMFSGNNLICRTQIISITFIEGYFDKLTNIKNAFVCINMTNINNLPKNITQFSSAFVNCYALNQQFDLSDYNITTNGLELTFQNCSSLTTPPILPSNYVGSMSNCFQNCTSLTTAPNIPNGVNKMASCFSGCTSLTTVPNIPNGVINMQSCFGGCTSLTTVPNIPSSCEYYDGTFNNCAKLSSVPIDGWKGNMNRCFSSCTSLNCQVNISSATNLEYTFYNCKALTITPTLPTTVNKCSMGYCFANCESLTTPPRTPEGVTSLVNAYQNCTSLTTAPYIPSSCINIASAFYNTKITTITIPLANIKVGCYTSALNKCSLLTDIVWEGERKGDFILTDLRSSGISQEDVKELVPEHLADLTAEGKTATLTLGETYGAYLTPDEVFSANAKGWTIVGASSDFTIINASDDVSGYTTDENVLSCFIELTQDNYKTRVDEVLQWYPNCTDLYLFEDGSVTSFNNISSYSYLGYNQIVNIVFMDGYFENLTDMTNVFRNCQLLESVNRIPPNVTQLYCAFYNCFKVTNIPELPKTAKLRGLLYNCKVFNQELDLSSCSITSTDGLQDIFYGCTSLTYTPILPSNYTGSMKGCFYGCRKITTAPTIPNGVTDIQSCFYNCSSLTTAPNIPSGVTNMQDCFYGCSALITPPTIPNGVTNMANCFRDCTALTTASDIPDSVNSLNYCYRGCIGLKTGASHISLNTTSLHNLYFGCTSLETAVIPLSNVTNFAQVLGGCSPTDITWEGELSTDLTIYGTSTSLIGTGAGGLSQADIQELVSEHLADLTALGTTATLTLGDYASYLTIGNMLSAQAKGWTIEGNFSGGDYAIINASTDLSAIEVNSDITTVIIELTNDNYKTRMNEVYTKYPSMTDILLIEDGTVTTLADMFNNSNNNACRSKIKKIEFLEGYFQNLTSLQYSFYDCTSLTDVSNIPSSVTNMYRAFYYCGELVNVSDFPDGVTNVNYTFYYCESLVTAPKLGKTTKVLDYTFYSCENLTSIPEFPPSATKLTGTFSGCSKLKNVPKIPDTVTDMSNCFYNCTALTEAPALPASIQVISSTFYGCSAMTKFPSIIPKAVTNSSSCFYSCKKMVTPPEFEHTDGSNLYPGRMFHNCSSMTTAPRLPEGLTNIQGMFMGCSKLEVPPTIPDSVTNMQEVFNNCTSLTQNPNVPTGVTNLKYAFANSSITAITIPLTNLTTYDYAISKCPNLTDVTWVGELTKTFNVKNLYYRSATDNTTPTATDIQELVPEHLGTVTGKTLTLGDYISHLSEDEISQAVAKGWTIQ